MTGPPAGEDWTYGGLVVHFVEEAEVPLSAHRIECTSDAFATADHVHVGDPVELVSRAYGPGKSDATDGHPIISYAVDSPADMSLLFEHNGAVITRITLYWDWL